jgi:hypothetical protein
MVNIDERQIVRPEGVADEARVTFPEQFSANECCRKALLNPHQIHAGTKSHGNITNGFKSPWDATLLS